MWCGVCVVVVLSFWQFLSVGGQSPGPLSAPQTTTGELTEPSTVRNVSVLLGRELSGPIDWCAAELQCRIEGRVVANTMCQFSDDQPNTRCIEFTSFWTMNNRLEVLKLHNNFRGLVAAGRFMSWPSATNMRRLSYDFLLEKMAYRWVKECDSSVDRCRKTPHWPHIGQKVFSTTGSFPENLSGMNSAFRRWESSLQNLPSSLRTNYTVIDSTGGDGLLLYSNTSKIGCANVLYAIPGRRFRRVIACNYGPGIGPGVTQLYETGAPCSNCPFKRECVCDGVQHSAPQLTPSSDKAHWLSSAPPLAPLSPLLVLSAAITSSFDSGLFWTSAPSYHLPSPI